MGFVPKSYIPNYSEFYEARHFTSGKGVDGVKELKEEEEEISFGTKPFIQM